MAIIRHRRLSFIVLLALVLTVVLGVSLQEKSARATALHAFAAATARGEIPLNHPFAWGTSAPENPGDAEGTSETAVPENLLDKGNLEDFRRLLASENAGDRERAGQWLYNLGANQPLDSPRRLAAASLLFDAWQNEPFGQTRQRFWIWIAALGFRIQEFSYLYQVGERPSMAHDYLLHGPYASPKREPANPAKNSKPPEAGTKPREEAAANSPPEPPTANKVEPPPTANPAPPRHIETGIWNPWNPDALPNPLFMPDERTAAELHRSQPHGSEWQERIDQARSQRLPLLPNFGRYGQVAPGSLDDDIGLNFGRAQRIRECVRAGKCLPYCPLGHRCVPCTGDE